MKTLQNYDNALTQQVQTHYKHFTPITNISKAKQNHYTNHDKIITIYYKHHYINYQKHTILKNHYKTNATTSMQQLQKQSGNTTTSLHKHFKHYNRTFKTITQTMTNINKAITKRMKNLIKSSKHLQNKHYNNHHTNTENKSQTITKQLQMPSQNQSQRHLHQTLQNIFKTCNNY